MKLYYNGTVLTMDTPPAAHAVLTDHGRILAVGEQKELEALACGQASLEDLKGAVMLPAFHDAHSHFSGYATSLLQVPLEECVSYSEIREKIERFIRERQIPPGAWVTAKGYDHNFLQEKAHPDRRLLDEAAPRNPLVIQHQSGHMGVFNTEALRLLHITPSTPVPEGGIIGMEEGTLTGYMEESAYVSYVQQVPMPSPEELRQAYVTAQQEYASHGIISVQEGMLVPQLVPLYRMLADSDLLRMDLTAYADAQNAAAVRESLDQYLNPLPPHIRLGGYKVFLDGSPQGKTAWMLEPYEDSRDYRGYPIHSDEEVKEYFRMAVREQTQLLAHCNGDAACEQLIRCCESLQKEGLDPSSIRPVMIHAQFLRRDQLDRVRAAGLIPSFFVAHIRYWGDCHIRNMGIRRASYISPGASAAARGIPFTYHQDSPVIKPNVLETVQCAVCRRTKEGVLLGETEQVSVEEALRAVTANVAYQYFLEQETGTITPGKRADFVILDRNPLETEPEAISSIRILKTIREDQVLYSASCASNGAFFMQ